MWIADNWTDYEVLDAASGEKLERWGDYILVRPDPQVIWHTGKNDARWSYPNGHYHRSKKGGGSWEFFDLLLNECQVVGTPGEGFGKCGKGFFRLTSFNTHGNTAEAVERIKARFGK